MKRFLLMILICVISVSGLCSCKENTESGNGVDNNNETVSKNATEKSNEEISIEVLKNLAETSEKEFSYIELSEDSVMITEYNGKNNIVVIPEKIDDKFVKKIENYVFANDSIVQAIKLPNSLEEIGKYVFVNNKNLKVVDMGKSLEIIPEDLFINLNVSDVKIGENIKNISMMAFYGCKDLQIIYLPESIQNIEESAFGGEGSENLVIQGKAGSVAESYAKENGFKFEAK